MFHPHPLVQTRAINCIPHRMQLPDASATRNKNQRHKSQVILTSFERCNDNYNCLDNVGVDWVAVIVVY